MDRVTGIYRVRRDMQGVFLESKTERGRKKGR